MRIRLIAVSAIIAMLLCSCEETTIIEDETPDVITIVEHIWHNTVEEIWHETTEHVYHETTIVVEDTTPDVITVYEYPSGPVPCLVLTEGGVPAMADQPLSGLTAATTINDPDLMLITQSGTSKKIAFEDFPMPTNYIGGLLCSMGTDADNDVDISPGSCRDNADAANLRLTAEITKQLDAAWAVGDDQGGLDTGSVAADTLYAIWLIKRSDTGVVDALFSTSFTSPTMPTNYDLKRLIGAVKTAAGSTIIPFIQTGDEFVYIGASGNPPPTEITDATITSATWETGTLAGAPPWSRAHIVVELSNPTATGNNEGKVFVRSTPVSNWGTTLPGEFANIEVNAAFDKVSAQGSVVVDGSKQMEYAAIELSGSATVTIALRGFTMLTRREPQ